MCLASQMALLGFFHRDLLWTERVEFESHQKLVTDFDFYERDNKTVVRRPVRADATHPEAQLPVEVPPLLEHSLDVKQVPFWLDLKKKKI